MMSNTFAMKFQFSSGSETLVYVKRSTRLGNVSWDFYVQKPEDKDLFEEDIIRISTYQVSPFLFAGVKKTGDNRYLGPFESPIKDMIVKQCNPLNGLPFWFTWEGRTKITLQEKKPKTQMTKCVMRRVV